MRAENNLPIMLNNASASAISPTVNANLVTSSPLPGITPSSINSRSNSGVAIIRKASITTVIRNNESGIL